MFLTRVHSKEEPTLFSALPRKATCAVQVKEDVVISSMSLAFMDMIISVPPGFTLQVSNCPISVVYHHHFPIKPLNWAKVQSSQMACRTASRSPSPAPPSASATVPSHLDHSAASSLFSQLQPCVTPIKFLSCGRCDLLYLNKIFNGPHCAVCKVSSP